MPTHNTLDEAVSRSPADHLQAQDFAPSANARMRKIVITDTPTRLNDLLGIPSVGRDAGPSKNVTKLRIHAREETFWLRRDPRSTLSQSQFEDSQEYLRIGADAVTADYPYITLILPDNPWIMMALGGAYPYGGSSTALVEEL